MSYFDEDDYGYFDEPSEADQIIEEAQEKLHGLLKKAALEDVREARNARNEAIELKEKIRQLEFDLNSKKEELAEIKKEIECEDGKIPRRYVDAFVRAYTKGIGIGDKVWSVGGDFEVKDCALCGGTGKVTLSGSGRTCSCPDCDGRGRTSRLTYSPVEKKVRSIILSVGFHDGSWDDQNVTIYKAEAIYDSNLDKYEAGGDEQHINFERLYTTKEEAQAEADKLNKKK